MPGRVFLSGGSGFVGSAVLKELVERGYGVNALVHSADLDAPAGADVNTVKGGLFDHAAVELAMRGCAAAIHLVGIIEEKPKKGVTFEKIHVGGTRVVTEAAERAGVPRYVHMSALGTRPDAKSRYHQSKWRAEQAVREGKLAWTIFRPSLIHGPGGDFMRQEAAWARGTAPPFAFMPYFGGGPLGLSKPTKLQPVYVGDVARAFADALTTPAGAGRIYNLAGPDVFTWPEFHKIASGIIRGKPKRSAPVPAWMAKAVAGLSPAALLPFSRDQVLMAREDNTGDTTEFKADFDAQFAPFADTLRGYAADL